MEPFDQSNQISAESPGGHPTIIGRFGRVFGVKGWIHIISFTDPKENILAYLPWWIAGSERKDQGWQSVIIAQHHQDTKGIRVKLEGCDSPEEAQLLVNREIAVPQERLPPLEVGQYYWSELIGARVKNKEGITLGVLDYLFETASNDVMVVKGEKEHWIPFLEAIVLQVNLNEKEILVDWEADF